MDFSEILKYSSQNNSGLIFLIQGAPGAGKTALLHECERLARESGWETAEKKMYPPALWSPSELRKSLGLRNLPKITQGSAQVSVPGIVKAEVSAEWVQATTLKILSTGKKPLLLKLDEAQTLGTKNKPPSNLASAATNVLDAIHNGELDRPVILIVGGLGTTADIFKTLGISRFEGESFVELDALGEESERAVLHDWITKEGRAKGDPTPWIDAISQETHGWPQHILSYVKPVLRQLKADNRAMMAEGLKAVVEAGCELRSAYYEQRARDFSRKQRQSLARLIANVPLGEGLDEENILESLTKEYGPDKAGKLFGDAQHSGILHKHAGIYTVPIPSMRDWLVDNYSREQIKFPQELQPRRSMHGRNPEIDLGGR